MAIVFAARGDSLNARYSGGGKAGITPNGGWTVTSDAGALSGSLFVAASNNSAKPILWPGRNNTPNGREISMLLRYKPGYTGSPSATRPASVFLSGSAGRSGRLDLSHNTAGNLVCTAVNEGGTLAMNAVSFGAWSPTSTVYYDVVFTWDGTTTANSAKVYVDASLISSQTPGAAFSSSWLTTWWSEISLSAGQPNVNFNAASVDEIVIWDTVITPSSVALVSGTGSLNGASRTSLVDVSSFDGQLYTIPTDGQIQTGVAVTRAGVSSTGTYTGADRNTDPGEANVRSGTAYKSNSTTNNKTGTLDLPIEADVRAGITFDGASKTGTYSATGLTLAQFLALK